MVFFFFCEVRVGVIVLELCIILIGMCIFRGDFVWDIGVIILLIGLVVIGEDRFGLLGGSGGGVFFFGIVIFFGDMLIGDEGEFECFILIVSILFFLEFSIVVDLDCGFSFFFFTVYVYVFINRYRFCGYYFYFLGVRFIVFWYFFFRRMIVAYIFLNSRFYYTIFVRYV